MVTEVTLYPYGCEESFSEHREHTSNEINAEEFKNMVISAGASITADKRTVEINIIENDATPTATAFRAIFTESERLNTETSFLLVMRA
jgi:hypothetical protein